MLSHEQNETLVRVGPKTPMGALLRLYWLLFMFRRIWSPMVSRSA